MTSPVRARWVFALVALTLYAVDILTKVLAVRHLDGRPDVPLVGDLLVLHLTRNPGAAFSTGTEYTVVLSCLAVVAVCVVLYLSLRVRSVLWAAGLGLLLAGVSVDYYTRLEKGNLAGASESVLHSIASALKLDDAERAHLLDLARALDGGSGARPHRTPRSRVRPGLQLVLDGMAGMPAFVTNGRMDLLAWNPLGGAFLGPLLDFAAATGTAPNFARFNVLDPAARDYYLAWDKACDTTASMLRTAVGQSPFLHPQVGDLELHYEVLPVSADDGQAITVYAAERGSPSEDALRLLASLDATRRQGRDESSEPSDLPRPSVLDDEERTF